MLVLIFPTVSQPVTKAFGTEKEKTTPPAPQIKTYLSAHTQRFSALDINKQNKLSSLAFWKKKMHTTHHQPDIHQVISQLHKIKRSSFCPFPLPPNPSLSQSKNPASNFLSWGALWGPRRGKSVWEAEGAGSAGIGFSLCLWSGHWHISPWLPLWGSSGRQGGE